MGLNLVPVAQDPFAPAPKLKPVAQDPFASAPVPSKYLPEDQVYSKLDSIFGAGKWRDTSGYRTVAHNAAVGGVPNSRHTHGTPDAPGANDIVVPGMSPVQVAARLKAAGWGAPILPEERVGNQGPHVHVDSPLAPRLIPAATNPFPEPAAKLVPVSHDPFAAAPALKPVKHNPFADVIPNFKKDFSERTSEAIGQFGKDVTEPQGGSLGQAGKTVMDAGNILWAGSGGPLIDQITRGPTESFNKATGAHVNYRDVTDIGSMVAPLAGEAKAAMEAPKAAKAMGLSLAGYEKVMKSRAAQSALQHYVVAAQAKRVLPRDPATIEGQKAIHRRVRGTEGLAADQATSRLVKGQKAAGTLTPEQSRDLMSHIEGRPTAGDEPTFAKPKGPTARLQASRIAGWQKNTPLKEAADTMRQVYRHYRARIEYAVRRNTGAAPDFIDNYFVHLWNQDADHVRSVLPDFVSKQGSGANLRKRSLPTIEDGLKAGLTLKYENPFEATAQYVANMEHFLATHGIQAAMKEAGYAGWYRSGQQPRGWVPLKGILTERVPRGSNSGRPLSEMAGGPEAARPAEEPLRLEPSKPVGEALREDTTKALPAPGSRLPATTGGGPELHPPLEDAAASARPVGAGTTIGEQGRLSGPEKPEGRGDHGVDKEVLYAHPNAAEIYNNDISRGLESLRGIGGDIYKGMRYATNATRMSVLGLSGYHALNEVWQSMGSEMARATHALSTIPGKAARGDVSGVAKAAGETAKGLIRAPVAPILHIMEGDKFQKALLAASTPEGVRDPVMRAYFESGGRLHMPDVYATRSPANTFRRSIARGTFGRDLKAALKPTAADRARGAVVGGIMGSGAGLSVPGAALGAATGLDLPIRTLELAMSPLFEDAIPRLKLGSFASQMRSWLAAHPEASAAEQAAQARKFQRLGDITMGNMADDNIFWHKGFKQVAQIVLLARNWTVGQAETFLGAMKDIPESVKGIATGKGVEPRVAFVVGLGATYALANSMMTYLKTGQIGPRDAADLVTYRTGGKTPQQQPERGLLPSFIKDPVKIAAGAAEGSGVEGKALGGLGAVVQVGKDKLSVPAGVASEYLDHTSEGGRNYMDKPIVRGAGVKDAQPGEPASRIEELAEDIAQRIIPILGKQMMERKQGTNISRGETLAGIRPAPQYLSDPKRAEFNANKYGRRDERSKLRKDRLSKAQLETP